jgi:hypothetical protein
MLCKRMEVSFNRTNIVKEELFHFVWQTVLVLVVRGPSILTSKSPYATATTV